MSPTILPNMVFWRSSHSVFSSVMKNWLPLLFGWFWLAQATRPLRGAGGGRKVRTIHPSFPPNYRHSAQPACL